MKKIVNALSIVGMVAGVMLILGSAGGFEQNTMTLTDMFVWCTFGFAIGSISAICYNKINN